MRNQLAEVLASKGIDDKAVLDAIRAVPRHLFMDSSFEDHAYQDKAFPIAADQTISQPYTVAFQTSLLQVKQDGMDGTSVVTWSSTFEPIGDGESAATGALRRFYSDGLEALAATL